MAKQRQYSWHNTKEPYHPRYKNWEPFIPSSFYIGRDLPKLTLNNIDTPKHFSYTCVVPKLVLQSSGTGCLGSMVHDGVHHSADTRSRCGGEALAWVRYSTHPFSSFIKSGLRQPSGNELSTLKGKIEPFKSRQRHLDGGGAAAAWCASWASWAVQSISFEGKSPL